MFLNPKCFLPSMKFFNTAYLQKHLDDKMRDITAFGSVAFYLLVFVLFLAVAPSTAWLLFIGLMIIHAVAMGIRAYSFKNRPEAEKHPTWLDKIDAASFPSIHAARTIFLMFTLNRYLMNYWLMAVMVAVLMLICFSRIYLRKHDVLDLGGGLVLGTLVYFLLDFL